MIHVSIVDEKGRILTLQDIVTVSDVRIVMAQAKALVSECEQFVKLRQSAAPTAKTTGIPYIS